MLGEYIYNGKGQRAEKWIESTGKCTVFHYNQNGLLIAESTTSGNIKAEYVYLNGQPLAKIEGDTTYYYHNDHLGTPMLMTDTGATTVWSGEYLPFGEEHSVTGSITNNLRFLGQYYDDETGLHYNYFRDYNPNTGRYVEADPIGIEQGMNHLYGYVGNNPVNFGDPWGLFFLPRGIPQLEREYNSWENVFSPYNIKESAKATLDCVVCGVICIFTYYPESYVKGQITNAVLKQVAKRSVKEVAKKVALGLIPVVGSVSNAI